MIFEVVGGAVPGFKHEYSSFFKQMSLFSPSVAWGVAGLQREVAPMIEFPVSPKRQSI
jgi:hypothetical protein